MFRFLFFALPLLLMAIGLWAFALDTFAADAAARLGLAGLELGRISKPLLLASWLLEALGLSALFLLLYSRGGGRWLIGIATGWVAWVFRGPLLVLAIAATTHLDAVHWWRVSLGWLVLYTLCGLLLAALAGMLRSD